MKKIILLLICSFMLPLGLPSTAHANQQAFSQWLNGVRIDAKAKGISDGILNKALYDIGPIDRIIELDRKQPEGTMTFATYRKRVINDRRVEDGRALYSQHRALLNRVSAKYGVPPQFIVALWGIETSYGDNTGGFGVIEALATLAYDGRRSAFFRKELMNALRILEDGHIAPSKMKGSWAGAMGQCQFMPSSFNAYAQDGNGDGKRDIWTTLPDVFSSTANYLSKNGWKEGERWGRSVRVPSGFSKSLVGVKIKKTLPEWERIGVRLPNGSGLPDGGAMKASIVMPDGTNGPAFLTYSNYDVIMDWNRSTYFATSVGLLADAIAR